jgi:hypothetical protein
MENITVGQIGLAVTFLVGLISGIGYLHTQMKVWIAEALKDQLKAIDNKMNELNDHIDDVDMNATKNFLVARLADIEQGHPLNEIEAERFWEQFEHYHKIGGNSYIDMKVEKLKSLGKL